MLKQEHLDGYHLVPANKLMKFDFPPQVWAIDDILPNGLALLAGRPKAGKSWMALKMCYSIAAGEPFLGKFPTKQKPAIYIGLEDNYRRLQQRLDAICGDLAPSNLYLLNKLEAINEGAEVTLEDLIERFNPGIIVIDTLARVTSTEEYKTYSYLSDYKLLGDLQEMAVNSDTAIVLVHHTRKKEAENEIDMISGTTGITAAVDTIMMLKSFGENRGKLHLTGRDIETQNYELDFRNGIWSYFGESINAEEEEKQFYEDVISLLDKGHTQTEVAQLLGTNQPKISRLLRKYPPRNDKMKIAS